MARNLYRRIQDRAGEAPKVQGGMEHLGCETVAPLTVASLRGGGRSTPAWWEALDEEGSGRGRIPRNPQSRPCRDSGVSQMSVMAAPSALNLVAQDCPRRDLLPHSFVFFTGLCEKADAAAPSFALLTGRHK